MEDVEEDVLILALHKCRVTFIMSLQSSTHLILRSHSRTEMAKTVLDVFVCFKLT